MNLKLDNNRIAPTVLFESLESRQLFAAGALDPSFSGDGITTFPFLNGGRETATNVAVQPDGKTVVVGVSEIPVVGAMIRRFAVARFNVDGTPDRTFGPQRTGKTTIQLTDHDVAGANAVAIQPDGKIVVAGWLGERSEGLLGIGPAYNSPTYDGDPKFAVVRLMPDGKLDKTFDENGKRSIDFEGEVTAVALQRDGKILLVGEHYDGGLFESDTDFAVARLNPNGSLDKSFDGDGKKRIGFGNDDYGRAIAVSGDKIVVAGVSGGLRGNRQTHLVVARLNLSNGAMDKTFGPEHDGKVSTYFTGRRDVGANAVLVQPSGAVVVAGASGDLRIANGTDFMLARYTATGALDTTFGTAHTGFVEVGFGGRDKAFGLIRSAKGGLIAAGSSNGNFAVAGLSADGVLDVSFGRQGKVVTAAKVPNGPTTDSFDAVGVAAAPGKRFVIAGGATFTTARYLDTGALVLRDGVLDNNLTLVSAGRVSGTQPFSSRLIDELI
jgi:uncharacterized delta-60 repeat protein